MINGTGLDLDYKTKPRVVNCEIHGENSPCYVNRNCIACSKEKQTAKENYETEERIRALKIANGVPERYLNTSFDNYTVTNDKQNQIVGALKGYSCDSNIVMVGQTGCGKTHLALACLNELLRKGKRAYYVKFYKLFKFQINDKQYFEKLLRADFLIIDEYGVSENEKKSNLLFEIIDERTDNNLPTVLISNLTTTAFKESISDALYSRLKENCINFSFNWADYRLRSIK